MFFNLKKGTLKNPLKDNLSKLVSYDLLDSMRAAEIMSALENPMNFVSLVIRTG